MDSLDCALADGGSLELGARAMKTKPHAEMQGLPSGAIAVAVVIQALQFGSGSRQKQLEKLEQLQCLLVLQNH